MPFEDAVKSHTRGANSTETKRRMPESPHETFSGLRIAMRLGTSSPNTMEK